MTNIEKMIKQLEIHHYAVGLALPELKSAVKNFTGDSLMTEVERIGMMYGLMDA